MSVIQSIRDKYARWAVVAIAVSLLGFILMDAFAGRSSMGNSSTTIGKINGRKVDYIDFERKVKAQEDMQRQQNYDMGESARQQLIQNVWDGEVTQTLMEEQFEELGLTIGKKELNDYLFGANPPQDLSQRFSDPNTGVYDAQQAQQAFNNVKRSGKPEDRSQLNEYIKSLEFGRMMEKYNSLVVNSVYFPKWFIEHTNTDNSLLAQASYVMVPYTTIQDSAVRVTNAEIEEYIEENKDRYQQKEETRAISYVVFSASPTAADTLATREQVENLREGFAATTDPAAYVLQQGSSLPFYDGYVARSAMQVTAKDSIFTLPKGGVLGPYLDDNAFVLARKIDEKILPDSARVRHILIQTQNPQTGQVMLDDSAAKKRIDSLETALRNGASFDSLVVRFSDDAGSKDKGGVYDYFPQGQMVKAFNDFAFEGRVGERKVVKTEFGYHLVDILGQKGSQPYYKVAYLGKTIVPSTETDNAASSQASMFAGESRNVKEFNANFDKNLRGKGYNKLTTTEDIRKSDYSISGLGSARPLVKAIFEADKGDVIEPHRVGDNYVVATVTDIYEKGLQSASKARPAVEPILRNQKKAAQIKKRIGNITTLENAAAATGQQVQRADSLRFTGPNIVFGFENKVIGAVFNPQNKGKVVPAAIEGTAGVYVVRPENISSTPVANADVNQQQTMMRMQTRQMLMYRSPVEALKESADIKDYRSEFY